MCQALGIQYFIRQIGPTSHETYSLKQWVETVKVRICEVRSRLHCYKKKVVKTSCAVGTLDFIVLLFLVRQPLFSLLAAGLHLGLTMASSLTQK